MELKLITCCILIAVGDVNADVAGGVLWLDLSTGVLWNQGEGHVGEVAFRIRVHTWGLGGAEEVIHVCRVLDEFWSC